MEGQLMIDGNPVVRHAHMLVLAEYVREGDMLFDLPVLSNLITRGQIVKISGYLGEEGFLLEVSKTVLLPITRLVPVMKGQCKVCGNDAKYRDLCAAHYQAQRRAARSVPQAGQNTSDTPLPLEWSKGWPGDR